MKRFFFVILILLTFNVQAKEFNSLVTFGDSLSDSGNLYRYLAHVLPKSPPYYQGRFSNGPLWIEELYTNLFPGRKNQADTNYAVGGAAAAFSEDAVMPYTLSTQVTDYIYLHDYKDKSSTLFNIWIGANNYLRSSDEPEEQLTATVIKAIEDNVETLIEHGGQSFFITNLPDLGKTPDATAQQSEERLTRLTSLHNIKLKKMIERLEQVHPNVTFVYFDVAVIFKDVLTNPTKYGLKDTLHSCYEGGVMMGASQIQPTSMSNYLKRETDKAGLALSNKQLSAIVQTPSLRAALAVSMKPRMGMQVMQCDGYAFWDHVHPTHALHHLIAQFAQEQLLKGNMVATQD